MNGLHEVIRLCGNGFATYDASLYSKITEALKSEPDTKRVQEMRRMAEAGPTLSSPRFAYPHIEDLAKRELAERD